MRLESLPAALRRRGRPRALLLLLPRLVLLAGGALAAAAHATAETMDWAPPVQTQPLSSAACPSPAPAPAPTHCDVLQQQQPQQQCEPPGAPDAAADPLRSLLAFFDQMRSAAPLERGREISRLNAALQRAGRPDEPPPDAAAVLQQQLRLGLLLSLTRADADFARAQALVQQVAESAQHEAQPLAPLARLLLARFAEQRRLEEQLDRLQQQLREQRRLDEQQLERLQQQLREQRRQVGELTQRLEAVRAIERSIDPAPPVLPTLQPASGTAAAAGAAAANAAASTPAPVQPAASAALPPASAASAASAAASR